MNMLLNRRQVGKMALAGLSATALSSVNVKAQGKTKIDFYYPVQVGGPVTKIVDEYIQKFQTKFPNIEVTSVYAGNYHDTTIKAITAARANTPPAVAVLLAVDKFTLIDEDVIEPLDDYIKSDADKAWVNGFMRPFLEGGIAEGKLWSVPFQRSTAVLYYNKQAFKEAGLDPERAPTTWDEMVEFGKAVTKKTASGQVTRWGVGIPGNDGSAQWLFEALCAQNGGARLVNDKGNETYFDDPRVIEALQYWVDLNTVHGIHPPGILQWGTAPADFLSGRLAMLWHTTGNLTNIRTNAKFDFGLAPYPGHPKPASVLGGGNIYVFKNAPAEQKAAALELVKFLTSDEILADWSIKTGYVAPRAGSWETEPMKKYVAEVPQALVALHQIPDSVPEFSTYSNEQNIKPLNDAIGAALTGAKDPATALKEAQAQADRVLKPYR
jgi:sn-glycerol 3-phosphate transport system substrate-binding protein